MEKEKEKDLKEKTLRKIELLSTSVWGLPEIMDYFDNIKSVSSAYRLKEKAKRLGGKVAYGKQYATNESVLEVMGVSRESELNFYQNVLRGLEVNGTNEQAESTTSDSKYC